MSDKQTVVTKDVTNKKIRISREFNAGPEQVWRAYTESDLLNQWWAPKPWSAETKFMDFREGGHWLYAMVGPGGERHWARMDYEKIQPQQSFSGKDGFCDEDGKLNPDLPGTRWLNQFSKTDTGTQVVSELSFESEVAMQQLLEMGFEEGMKMAIENLVVLLAGNNAG